eukprot:scaffold1008_cov96-Isochrysis_galbana.AAC.4
MGRRRQLLQVPGDWRAHAKARDVLQPLKVLLLGRHECGPTTKQVERQSCVVVQVRGECIVHHLRVSEGDTSLRLRGGRGWIAQAGEGVDDPARRSSAAAQKRQRPCFLLSCHARS